MVWVLFTLFAFYILTNKMFERKTAIWATVILSVFTSTPFLEGNINNSEILMILPTSLAIFYGLKERYFLSGVLFSLSVLLKFPAVFDFAAFFIFVALLTKRENLGEGIKNLVKLTAGLFIPILLTVIYFTFQGALADYFRAAFLYNLSYTSYKNTFIIPNGLLIVKALPLVVLVGYFFVRLYQRFKRKSTYSFSLKEFLIVWLAFSYYAATFGGRPYEHYLIQAVPALSIIIALTITNTNFRKFGIFTFVVVALLTLFLKFTPVVNPSYYPNFFKFVLGKITFDEYGNSFNQKVARNYAVSSYLKGCETFDSQGKCDKERADEGAQTYIFANEPAIYFLSGLDPVSPYVVFFHIGSDDKAKRDTAKRIKSSKPKYILVEDPRPGNFPELEVILSTSYNHFANYENIVIFKYQERPSLPTLF
jgi:hypothetical protein